MQFAKTIGGMTRAILRHLWAGWPLRQALFHGARLLPRTVKNETFVFIKPLNPSCKMKPVKTSFVVVTTLSLLAGCGQPPMGPRVAVMPAPGKPFEVFQQEDAACRQFAQQQSAGVAEQGNNAQVGSAVIGTVLGAGLGAAIGGGRGAAIGAGAGALGGTAVGAGQAERGQYTAQRLYDNAYSQCMYSHGNQVPGFIAAPPPTAYVPAPPSYPPPPPGYPPPPPR